jgi:hypothetical protein
LRGKFHFRAAKISLRSNFTLPQAKFHCGEAAQSPVPRSSLAAIGGKLHFRAAKTSLRSNFTLPQAKLHCAAGAGTGFACNLSTFDLYYG